MQNRPTTPAQLYAEAAAEQDKQLGQALTLIRRQEDAGSLTVTEAAGQRITAMEKHLAALQAARAEHFGSEGRQR
jgi:hypothetical protein